MEYVVSFTLLVALLAWVVSAYLRLFHFYEQVQAAWQAWWSAARNRNECAADFAGIFGAFLPPGDALPGDICRWTADSERALAAVQAPPGPGSAVGLNRAERHLRHAVSGALHTAQSMLAAQQDTQLPYRCEALAASQYRLAELALLYNRRAGDYNAALSGPGAGLVASVFGFLPVEPVR